MLALVEREVYGLETGLCLDGLTSDAKPELFYQRRAIGRTACDPVADFDASGYPRRAGSYFV